MFTHKVGVVYSNDAGSITSTTDTYLVDSEVNLDEVVTAGSTNKEYDISIKVANIKTMVLWSSVDATLKVNSTSSPTPTIALSAGKQTVWNIDHLEACPLTTDVTKFYVSVAGIKDATFKFRCGLSVAV